MHESFGQVRDGKSQQALGLFFTYLTSLQNKSLSDNFDPLLALQGLSWLTRKAIGLATVVV
jgi:hypothetical protein